MRAARKARNVAALYAFTYGALHNINEEIEDLRVGMACSRACRVYSITVPCRKGKREGAMQAGLWLGSMHACMCALLRVLCRIVCGPFVGDKECHSVTMSAARKAWIAGRHAVLVHGLPHVTWKHEMRMQDLTNDKRLVVQEVGPDEIAHVVSRWTGVPVMRLTQEEKARLRNLGEELHRRLVGQTEAVALVADAVMK